MRRFACVSGHLQGAKCDSCCTGGAGKNCVTPATSDKRRLSSPQLEPGLLAGVEKSQNQGPGKQQKGPRQAKIARRCAAAALYAQGSEIADRHLRTAASFNRPC